MPSADLAVRAATEQEANTVTASEPKTNTADPVQRALALCESLRSIAAECHDLVRTLKRQRREARLVQTTLASLRQLQEVA